MLGITRLRSLLVVAILACTPSLTLAQSSMSDAQVDGLAKMYRDARTKYEALVRKADAGGVDAQFVLGAALYDQGIPGVARDQARGMKYLEMAAAKGNAEALAALGLAYEQGRAVKRDYVKASNYYVEAGRRGNARAQFLNIRLAAEMVPHPRVEQMGALELAEDAELAFKWYDAHADENDAKILTNLGRAYAIGLGTERNAVLALVYSARAARQGSVPAKANITKLLKEFQASTLPVSTALRSGVDTQASIVEQQPKGTALYPLMRRDGWILALNPKTYAVGYVPENLPSPTKKTVERRESTENAAWPARPAAAKGTIRCNTQCKNGDCYRTYSDGRKVRFQAKQVWDSVKNTFVWDSGGC